MEADILLVHDVPARGWVTFRALKACEVGFLHWLTSDLQECVQVDERSFAVHFDDADHVYSTLLLNGLVIAWPDGDTIGIGEAPIRAILSAIDRARAVT